MGALDDERQRLNGATRDVSTGGSVRTYPMSDETRALPGGDNFTSPGQQTLPASPSGGIAPESRTPVGNGANESQGGAGNSNIDLVPDRGTPKEYTQSTMTKLGSEKVLDITVKSAEKSNHTSGAMGEDPEMAKLQGSRLSDEMGITDNKKGENNRAAMENMFGDMYDNALTQEVTTGTTSKKEAMIKSKKYKGIFAGMTREEFSMFLFDMGGSLMANGEQGLGALGVASQDAIAGHRGRMKEEEASASAASALLHKQGIETQNAESATMNAGSNRMNAETNADRLGQGYQGKDKFLIDYYRSQGMTEKQISDRISGASSPEATYDIVADDIAKMVAKAAADPPMIPNQHVMVDTTGDGKKDTALHLMDSKAQARLAKLITEDRMEQRGALGGGTPQGPALAGGGATEVRKSVGATEAIPSEDPFDAAYNKHYTDD